MIVPLDGKRRIRRELFARLVDPPPGAADDPGEDQRLGLGSTFGKTPLDEELIGPPLRGLGVRHGVPKAFDRQVPRNLGLRSAHRNFARGTAAWGAARWQTRSRA